MTVEQIPRFFLYGEPPRAVGDHFLHLEAIDDRARPSDWNIRPHAHGNLSHVFNISGGGGEMSADARLLTFRAPCLLVVPSNVVHGIVLEPETTGSVLTISDAYLQELVRRAPDIRQAFAATSHLPTNDPRLFADLLERLSRELAWTAIGHAAAVEALLVSLLIEVLRLAHQAAEPTPHLKGAQTALVARFRELVEARYRSSPGVEAYAEALNVHPKRLRAACLRTAGVSPGRIIHDRLLLEAKRLMLYSNMTVVEAGYYLGFTDPAYFTRFFTKRSGVSPRRFRNDPAAAEAAES